MSRVRRTFSVVFVIIGFATKNKIKRYETYRV